VLADDRESRAEDLRPLGQERQAGLKLRAVLVIN
jgi:hypothetical protein